MRVDYLIQCVAAAVLLVLQMTDPHNTGADCDGGHGTNGIDSDRDKCIREDLLAMLTKALTPPSQLEKIPANVITKIVNNKFYRMCFSLLHDSLASTPHNTDEASILHKFVKHNLLTPQQVVSVLLVPLVQKEVMAALSATADSHHQTTSQSHSPLVQKEVMAALSATADSHHQTTSQSHSPLVQKEVMAALSVTADSHHQTTSQSHSPLVQKEVMGALSVTADSHHQTTSQSHSPLVQKEVMAALSVTADSHHQTTSQSHSPLVQKEVMAALSVTADSHHQTTSQSHSPLVQKEVMAALSVTADSHHQTTSQSHSPLVQKEVMGALSVTPDSHHQTTSQSHSHKRRFSETEPSALKVVNLSRWWKDALDMLSEAFCKWCDSGGGGGGGGSVGMEVEDILAHLVFHHTKKEQEGVLKFIAATTDIHIQYIRRCSVQNQINELVLGLHEHRGGVLQEFSHMKTIDPSVEQQSGVSSLGLAEKGTRLMKGSQGREEGLQEIADYLSPRLLGILGFLDSKLVSSSTMYKEKR
ncbi:hypothetical protein Pmani_000170 [Petrolisthes manimaculis]|uniref:Uncharacterized protein n=1 Tax=Petrolisthes manimaculis TaxID=1843537 RepID=A0AAE1QNF1_9EUCA|nr:hypothetical protein Pmani_000170 [Petrolisthes manimaculis]